MNRDRYGAAVHEAGHVVVAWAFGLKTRTMVVGINGDDSAGRVEIADASHLPVVDRIAICSAGRGAQRLFDAPTNDRSDFRDLVKIRTILLDHLGDENGTEAESLRAAGFRKSLKLIEIHRDRIARLTAALAHHGELDQAAIDAVLADG